MCCKYSLLVSLARVSGSETLILRNIESVSHIMDIRPSLLLHSMPKINHTVIFIEFYCYHSRNSVVDWSHILPLSVALQLISISAGCTISRSFLPLVPQTCKHEQENIRNKCICYLS
jgi:hypothetical protein